MNMDQSTALFEKAKQVIPGGVNSPVRAFLSVGMTPPFIRSARGARLKDADGNEYIDYVCSWGPLILGHAREEVIDAIREAAADGTSFGAPTEREIELAELICSALPAVEMVRMVNSGTEAVMSAIRLARGFTGRKKILKFEGCYHGHSDALLVEAGSGLLTLSLSSSAGVPEEFVKHTLTVPYNDCEKLETIFEAAGAELAAVIVEPVAGNMGVVKPDSQFLRLMRRLTEKYGSVLIFDEVITGFRVSFHGAQGYYGISPDLTVLGKIIGGGMPVGAYGGRKDIMRLVAPLGPVYQAGTLSGNPVAMAAGIKTLQILKDNPAIYREIDDKAAQLEKALIDFSDKYRIPLCVNRVGSLLSAFFTDETVTDYRTAKTADTSRFATFFSTMFNQGIYIAPSQFEAMFISGAHSDADIKQTIAAIEKSFAGMQP
ncbi:MAG TPA: glutamate-1-semialdehyde-2,1-aminomutase [Firmicutes bacterium]|jgi:glutamate-1-semialdehyde 2,1-aminomutase|nr:glutamate-1-semialdehyde-2,1-aminomutase [Bacillota bacterium]